MQSAYGTSIDNAADAYIKAVINATDKYENEYCRLTGRYYDAVKQINLGYGIDASFYGNGATSTDVQVCFAAGYEIELADGTKKRIEDFDGTEEIWARHHDDPSGALQKCKVIRAFKNGVKETMLARFGNGLELRGTSEHPFYVEGKGWTPLGKLAVGDVCLDREQKPVVVKEILRDNKQVEVYNIEVEGCHTYYIGKDGLEVLVHNECIVCNGTGLINKPQAFGYQGSSYGPPVVAPEIRFVTVACHCTNPKSVTQKQLDAFFKSVGEVIDGVSRDNAKISDFADLIQVHRHVPFSRDTIVTSDSRWVTVPVLSEEECEGLNIKYVGTKFHNFASCSGEIDLFGPGGLGPCIGVAIFSKSADMRAAFHFGPESCHENKTLKQYNWPPDSRAVIAGGINEGASKGQLSRTIGVLKSLGITLEGVSNTSAIYCDKHGNWVIPAGPGTLKP